MKFSFLAWKFPQDMNYRYQISNFQLVEVSKAYIFEEIKLLTQWLLFDSKWSHFAMLQGRLQFDQSVCFVIVINRVVLVFAIT